MAEQVQVYVVHPCVEECFCESRCNVRDSLDALRTARPNVAWTASSDRSAGSVIQQIENALAIPDVKIVILWNLFCKEEYERQSFFQKLARTQSTREGVFLLEVREAEYRRAERGIGNCLIHVAVERKAVPERILRWDTPVRKDQDLVANLMQRINERPLDQKDLSPCGEVGVGLAYTFFAKYLKRILHPEEGNFKTLTAGLEGVGRLLNAESLMCKALITIIPRSGITPDSMPEGLQVVSALENFYSTGGVLHRSYKRTVYELRDGQQVFYAAVEFATPVRAMYKMQAGFEEAQGNETNQRRPSIAGMSDYWLKQEIQIFTHNLGNLCRENLTPEEMSELIFIDFDDLRFAHRTPREYESNQELAAALKAVILEKIKVNLSS